MKPNPKADELPDPRVLSFVAAGRYLGGDTSPETIRSWAKRGMLRRIRIGHRTFVLREDLDRLIDAQLEVEAPAQRGITP